MRYMEAQEPDVVVLDIQDSARRELEIAREVKRRWAQTKVLALALYPRGQSEQLAACADAVISKGEPPARLLNAVSKGAWSA